jgi:hypothetical protein
MKTNQLLLGGGIIALIYILYKKKKSKNGSDMIQDALNGDLPEVSQSDGDKGTSEPVKGGQKSCKQAMAEFNKIAMTSRMPKEALQKLQKEMLKGCIGAMPMPSKPFILPPSKPTTKPTTKPYYPSKPPTKPQKPWRPPVGKPVLGFSGFSQNNNINNQLGI